MLAKVLAGTTIGVDSALVEVEADISQGLPKFDVVGLGDAAVQEARQCVRAAIKNSGFTFPTQRITVNLAPAEVRKEGAGFDVPIAIAVLAAAGIVPPPSVETLFLGEVSLDGSLRHTTGVLPMVALARERRFSHVVVPLADATEASLIDGVTVFAAAAARTSTVKTPDALLRAFRSASTLHATGDRFVLSARNRKLQNKLSSPTGPQPLPGNRGDRVNV